MMKPDKPVGIVGYGVYIPRYRIAAHEIARVWADGQGACRWRLRACPAWMKTQLPCRSRPRAVRWRAEEYALSNFRRYGSAAKATPTPSSHRAQLSPKRLVQHPGSALPIGSSRARLAPRRSPLVWEWLAAVWPNMCWRL